MTNLHRLLSESKIAPETISLRTGIELGRLQQLYEPGAEPSLRELRKIASILKVPLASFVPSSAGEERAAFLLRSAAVGTKHTRPHTLDRLSRSIGYALDLVGAPVNRLPWLKEFRPGDDSYQGAEQNAGIFRNLFLDNDQIGPFHTLPDAIVENTGIFLFVIDATEIDGASAIVEGRPFIFVSSRFEPRMLFTLAHEIGHIINHRDLTSAFAVLDHRAESIGGAGSINVGERFAHAFASCLLMPTQGVAVALKKIKELAGTTERILGDAEILYLARIFGVSFAVAAMRCEGLSLLPHGGAMALDKEIRKTYGSAEKRAQQLGLPARPEISFPRVPITLLDETVEEIRAGNISLGRASALLGMSVSELVSANAGAQR